MNNPFQIPVLFVGGEQRTAKEMADFFATISPATFLCHTCSIQEALTQSYEIVPTAVVVHLGNDPEQSSLLIQQIISRFPSSKVYCVSRELSVPLILKLIKIGAKDFLQYPLEEQAVRTLTRQLESGARAFSLSTKNGHVITFYGPKGGVGVTLLTVNIAVALAKSSGLKVAVTDLHPQCGDIATYLNLSPEHTLRDLVDQYDLLDASFLEGVMLKHSSGVRILAAPHQDQEPLRPDCLPQVQAIINLLKQNYDFILIDAGHSETAVLNSILDLSDTIYLIGNLDVPSLKGLVSSFNRLLKMRFIPEKIQIVINRFNAKNRLDTKEFERQTKQSIAFKLPNDYALCIEAINTGRPISELQGSSSFVQKLDEIAAVLKKAYAETDNQTTSRLNLESMKPKARTNLKRWLGCLF